MRYRKSFPFLGRKHPVSRGGHTDSLYVENDVVQQERVSKGRAIRCWTEGSLLAPGRRTNVLLPDAQHGVRKREDEAKSWTY